MTRHSLTKAERRIFHLIRAELVAGRLAPTFEELLRATGLRSKSGIHRVITALVEKGYITCAFARPRSIALVPGAETYTVHLPADLDARLGEHVAARAATPEAVITKAVHEYLARQP